MIRLFVYGTLMRGLWNHGLLERANFICRARTVPGYVMVANRIPYVYADAGSGTTVAGEVYMVNAADLARIDDLEGHPDFYRRTPIKLDDGFIAEAYLLPRDGVNHVDVQLVKSGSFRDHIRETRR